MTIDLEHVEEVRVVRVQPGDVIWLKTDRALTQQMLAEIKAQAERFWPDNKIAIGAEIDLSIIRPVDE